MPSSRGYSQPRDRTWVSKFGRQILYHWATREAERRDDNKERVKTVADFILRDSKITADGDCSHEIKRCLLLGRKVMTNLDIQKQRHYFAY